MIDIIINKGKTIIKGKVTQVKPLDIITVR